MQLSNNAANAVFVQILSEVSDSKKQQFLLINSVFSLMRLHFWILHQNSSYYQQDRELIEFSGT